MFDDFRQLFLRCIDYTPHIFRWRKASRFGQRSLLVLSRYCLTTFLNFFTTWVDHPDGRPLRHDVHCLLLGAAQRIFGLVVAVAHHTCSSVKDTLLDLARPCSRMESCIESRPSRLLDILGPGASCLRLKTKACEEQQHNNQFMTK